MRVGFDGSDAGLPDRIRRARKLAFYYVGDRTVAAIAGLKVPGSRYRAETFASAKADADPADFELELGWVFVEPAHRGARIARVLCERLVAGAPELALLATTRENNRTMRRILAGLEFEHAGRPYPRNDEQLVLYLRASRTS